MNTDKINIIMKNYPKKEFLEAFSCETYETFVDLSIKLLKRGYPVSELYDILETHLLNLENKRESHVCILNTNLTQTCSVCGNNP